MDIAQYAFLGVLILLFAIVAGIGIWKDLKNGDVFDNGDEYT